MYHSFRPGEEWLDTNGKPIQAHGGSVFFENGTYYWYGENKEYTDGKNGVWTWGVRCYSSQDLYNWKDEGLIVPPDERDETSPLHPTAMLDRPHILYNRKTKKYVCWCKIMQKNGEQTETVLTSDRLLGPYTIQKTGLKPLGMSAGDFDLAVAPDGKGYYFFERVHSETIIADLTDDYCDVTGYYSTHFPHAGPPYVREATAHFVRGGKHYLLTFRVQGTDLFIAMADRWLPDCTYAYEDYKKAFERRFILGKPPLPEEEKYFSDAAANTSRSRYVWLPIRFEGEKPVIEWHTEWHLSDYI